MGRGRGLRNLAIEIPMIALHLGGTWYLPTPRGAKVACGTFASENSHLTLPEFIVLS